MSEAAATALYQLLIDSFLAFNYSRVAAHCSFWACTDSLSGPFQPPENHTVIRPSTASSITVWFGSASKSDIRRLQRTVRTAERIIGVHLPSLQDLYYSRVKKRAGNIITDPSHPGHDLFALLPSGRRYRSLCTRTSRHKNSFFPYAISSLNN